MSSPWVHGGPLPRLLDAAVPGTGRLDEQGQRDALLYLQIRSLNGDYRDDLDLLHDRLAQLARHAPHHEHGLQAAAQDELARYRALSRAQSEPQQSWQRRRDQQWHAVLCELDQFLDRHADDAHLG